jgi:D-alanyl-D-alanine dipeptidase
MTNISTLEAASFESNLKYSTGYATYNMALKKSNSDSSATMGTVTGGKPFLILSEVGDWWQVEYNGVVGYVKHAYCMINLPDVITSITYNISNATSSIYVSSGYSLPGVTGTKLYSAGKVNNNKIGKNEYIVPVLYSTAKMIGNAQNYALAEGYSLKIYDAYRPSSVSTKIRDSLNSLYNSNQTVRNNINYSYGLSGTRYTWGKGWFLAQGVSTHNTGSAIDVTLTKKDSTVDLTMPSKMHELSVQAIKYYSGSASKTEKNYAKTMNDNAKKLHNYFTKAGMESLSSEWWHFQDNNGHSRIKSVMRNGCNFQVTDIVSKSTPKPTPKPTATPKPTVTPTPTVTPAPTATPKPTPEPTVTPKPTSTPTPTEVLEQKQEKDEKETLLVEVPKTNSTISMTISFVGFTVLISGLGFIHYKTKNNY